MKNWVKKSIAIVATAALMVPTTSAFAEAPQKTAKNQELVKLASNKEQTSKNQKDWISKDTIIVKHSGLDKNVHKNIGSKVIRSIPSLGYDVIKLNKGTTLEKAVPYYAKQKGVKSVSPSYVYHSFGTGEDPKKKDMYHLNLLQIDKALELAGNNEVKVAVIDSGVDFKHPDLKSQVLPPYNAAAPANTSYPAGHGTHVAGIISAAKDNGIGGHGINPNAKILPIDVFNGGKGADDFVIAQGILYAIEQGADVINMSLGGYGENSLLKDAVQKAIDKGITIVAAAGNESTDDYSFPASYEGVISVGSTNDRNELSGYSNYGPSVDVVAPGEGVYSTFYDEKKESSFKVDSGTSMASPIVAGIASLLKSKYPNLKPHEIEAILEMTAKDLGKKGYDLTFGHGLVDPVKALQFDLKNLPKQYSETKGERMKNAKVLKKNTLNTEKGEFKQPDEKKWYKVDLEANEYAQLTLKGANKYDYAFDLYFYPEGHNGEVEPINVNDVRVGKQEGYLYKADQKGTLLIGVKDYNGSYSTKGDSNYVFTAQTIKKLPIDSLDMEHKEKIQKFPFSTAGKNYTLLSEDHQGDQDYFTFTVNKPTTLKFDLSDIPGVTIASLELYLKEDLGKAKPIQASYGTDKGNGVSLVVDAIPNKEYVISVTNRNPFDTQLKMFLSGGTEEIIYESIIPYTLKGEIVTIPKDEDGLPLNKEQKAQLPIITDLMNKYSPQDGSGIPEDMDVIDVDLIMEKAIRFDIGKNPKAYFQTEDDEDYFLFTAKEDALYGFQFKIGMNQSPASTIYEYNEETNELSPVTSLTNGLGRIDQLLTLTNNENDTKPVALKKGKTYVVKVINLGERSSEPYTLKTSKIAAIPEAYNRDNKTLEAPQMTQPGITYKNHLIYQEDTDYYYYKHQGKDEVMSLHVSSVPFTNEQLDQLPKELQKDLELSGLLVGALIEDTNGDMEIYGKEWETAIQFGQGNNLDTSFKAKKDHGYFIAVRKAFEQVSIQPYTLTLFDHKRVDEDADSKLVNGIPTKPTVLTKKDDKWVATQYLNAGVPFGDKDYFEFTNDRKRDVFFSLQTEKALDGVIRIIDAKGKTVETLDLHGDGDAEVGTVQLDEGTYYIEVSDFYGRASTQPYTLEII
ncbi:peptidase S8 [Lysinibacillus sphaericus]|uniref:S8 family peptidase n=1 Tax=Lysinibacillus sphaericus TaxID=1421 RepID=UPI0018CF60BB|nr:S8 family peptidase [Lysinibacillus sphaericus]MBG9454778.1 peptidase S8 [Lysinibacillus sphaericus]MBG9478206.1 peptidase S8 [Lysinibacillus sphaericus]MBG9590919.1 peptidase S8 [Lysinibacillus sphaericus]